MSGPVIISPHVKRNRIRIDQAGNEIDPKTKQILKFNQPDYVPTREEIEAKINVPAQPAPIPQEIKVQPENPLANMIQKKVEEAVAASLAKIDIAKMVEDAINKAFK